MKSILFIIFISSVTILKINGQTDQFNIGVNVSFIVIPMNVSGTADISHSDDAVSGSYIYPVSPVYRHIDTLSVSVATIAYFNVNLPIYRTQTQSAGIKMSLGGGRQYGYKAADGFNYFLLDFPQFIYYRNYATTIDFSVLAGYKYTRSPYSYHYPLLGIEFNINKTFLRVYGSPCSYKYYRMYTNGTVEPMITIREFGLAAGYKF